MPKDVVHSIKEALPATQVRWPSRTIRFIYVSDISLDKQPKKETMAHSPALDVAGLLLPGSRLLVTRNAATCKTPYAIQLVEDEGELALANPSRANHIVRDLLDRQLVPTLRDYKVAKAEVSRGDSRFDFQLLNRRTGKELLLEVKHVSTVDTAADAPEPPRKKHFVVRARASRADGSYARAALFPVDRAQQRFKGKHVVSERAIRHVAGMRKLQGKGVDCCILFLVTRGDASSFRPCEERCPVFAAELRHASEAGVRVVAPQISWDWHGNARFKTELPVEIGKSAASSRAKSSARAPKAKKTVSKRPAARLCAAGSARQKVKKTAGIAKQKRSKRRL
eukprot:gnl/TRDRNA2_/TRDRNA2_81794_c0_seq3.p1 gnl/TRDRNA2_/TRDRNA2_81794_c0~~gnl/TRDRNA2_/TRDRNA2_81794_c0_seq3.p1  ORF type:complete len:338 (-),score=52.48 gnl/TRDRNA2_/TRDRNA2_81794_c0_seq3:50-1063(-)